LLVVPRGSAELRLNRLPTSLARTLAFIRGDTQATRLCGQDDAPCLPQRGGTSPACPHFDQRASAPPHRRVGWPRRPSGVKISTNPSSGRSASPDSQKTSPRRREWSVAEARSSSHRPPIRDVARQARVGGRSQHLTTLRRPRYETCEKCDSRKQGDGLHARIWPDVLCLIRAKPFSQRPQSRAG
jgi:hypothetical protein